ncbi:hypothetical protein OAH76_02770 [Verrucomicrobia bacterium]|nr:hypothetical protein [Verrucomicrobiota bacterium]MDA7665289.1 hypothetical protein [Verrucomicrobiota bacterium]MDB4803764.1 hypothetical protein [Verrucomicrobiota bacterium]
MNAKTTFVNAGDSTQNPEAEGYVRRWNMSRHMDPRAHRTRGQADTKKNGRSRESTRLFH